MTTYGPHRDDDAPNAVVVLGPESWPSPVTRALPDALIRQRRAINARAAGQSPAGSLAGRSPRFDPEGGGRRG